MSYILDALRKLERERRPQAVASLVTLGAPAPARRAVVWPIVGGAALLVNVMLLAVLLWPAPPASQPHPDRAATPAPTDAVSPAPDATSSAAATPAATLTDTVRPPAVPVPSTEASSEPSRSAAAAGPGSSPGGAVSPAVPAAPPSRPAPATSRVAPPPPLERTPPVKPPVAAAPALSRGAPSGVPRLKLEVLVYSETSADRFVFINGRKYVEGQSVSEGVTLEQITQDGAVLSYGGQPFVLRE